jgi:hypothetical protein
VTYTASCYAKSGGGTKRYLNVYPQTAGTAWAIFDLDLGTVPATGGAQYVSSSITSAGNGWYRCSVTVTANTTAALNANYYIGDSSSTPAPTYTGNGTSALYIWGAQLNTGTSALPYAATTSAPYTLCTPKGLLIEEARTNLLTYSEQFDNAAWVKGDVTVTANAAVSPDGTTNADSVIEAATTAIHRINQSATISLSTAAAISFYVQAIGSRRLYINAVVAANVGALFDLTGSGTVVDLAGVAANKAASISQIGNGWYRCTVIGTGTGVANNIYAQINRSTSVTAADDTYLGDGTSGIRVYGAQMEAGSFATSYIPTVASTVTRSADVASMTGTNFSSWYNATQGTLFTNWTSVNTVQSTVAQISDGTANNRMLIQGNNGSGTMRNLVFVAGVAQVTTLDFSIAAGTHKDALAYSAGSYGASRDGAVTLTNSYASVPSGMNTLGIGYDGAAYANGWLASISYYNTRLPNSTLQALTA